MSKEKNTHIAKINNQFVYNAQYNLTARESKVVLYLIAKIDPVRQENLISQVVSIRDLEKILRGDAKRWGGIYDELVSLSKKLVKKGIEFSTEIELNGKRLPGYINWFQHIMPCKDEDGNIAMEFLFAQSLQPFLLNLKEYVSLNFLEVAPLKSAFSIRMFQVFRAHRDRMAKHQKRSKLRYELEELKLLLGVSGKYSDYRNFRLKVLEVLKKEVNKETSIGMNYTPIKKGRSIVEIEFEIWDKDKNRLKILSVDETKSGLKFEEMTYSQIKAFDMLVSYGVNDGIAMQMIAKVKGSEIRGFEDWYFGACIQILEDKSNQQGDATKAGVLVNWFLKLKVFEQGDQFAKIMETLAARKKGLENSNVQAWENRLAARGMTAGEFRKMVKE
jgi:plasmid replication initiation protein